jgi:hypothetical protein
LSSDLATRKKILLELSEATPEGRQRRIALQNAITQTSHEFHGLGIEMGQVYTGPGIYDGDETAPYKRQGRGAEDEVLFYDPSTYPGCRLPHVWLNQAVPTYPVSTIDLAGHGAFTLFTGIGGAAWKGAAEKVSVESGIPIHVHCIGFRQEWEDTYYDWERLRGVDEDGAVLVRPDRVVAWRAQSNQGVSKLSQVMRAILGLRSD